MNDEDRQSAKWLRACRRGDDRSARLLYAHLAPALRRYARAILRDDALADDAVQSAFCKVMKISARDIRRIERPGVWMATLVRREALTTLRARRREARRAANGRNEPPDPRLPDPALREALDRLPRQLREIVVLKHVGSMTFEQIAAALGINRNTAAWRHARAIRLLHQELAPKEEVSRA